MSWTLALVRSIYAGWERGDFSSTAWADPEIEFVIADGPDPRRMNGLAAMSAGWREFLTAWADYAVRAERYREIGDGRVLVILHASGRGRTSGAELEQAYRRGANVFDAAGDKVTRLAIYFDCEHAFADLGLKG
jgi:ketosteroid isomerase-like protein